MELQTDSLGRRIGQTRQPRKELVLTENDVTFFKALNRYKFSRTTFLNELTGRYYDDTSRRLGELFHNGYLDRVRPKYEPAIYTLNGKSEAILKERGIALVRPKVKREDYNSFRMEQNQDDHELMICDIVASIEIACNASSNLRFIPWQSVLSDEDFPEETRKSKHPMALPCTYSHNFDGTVKHGDKPVIPDAVFGIEYDGDDTVFFALEADRHTESVYRSNLQQSSYLRKFLQYQSVMKNRTYRQRWGIESLLILNVTINTEHRKSMERLLGQLMPKGCTYQLFKDIPVLAGFARAPAPSPEILTEPWCRVGNGDFNISQGDRRGHRKAEGANRSA